MQRLLNASLHIKAHPRIHLSRYSTRHDLQNLSAELHKQVIEGSVDLLIEVLAVLLSILARIVDQLRILGLLRCGEDERWVRCGILWLVFADGREVTGIADDDLQCEWSC